VSDIVAAICVTAVEQPGSAADILPPEGGRVRFLAIDTLDGGRMDAVVREPGKANGTWVVCVHGSGGNYAASAPGILLRALPSHGYTILGINTRQSGARVNSDNFFDVRYDIEAAIATAKHLGATRIVLHGQSLGNIQVQFVAATTWDPVIAAVILTGMFADLPWKSRYMLIGDDSRYNSMRQGALEMLRSGRSDSLLTDSMPSYNNAAPAVPLTAQHFLTYRDNGSSAASGLFWIKRIPRPVLLVRDEGDQVVERFEATMLLAAARSEGSLVPRIDFVSLPNSRGPNVGGHGFEGNEGPLASAVLDWLHENGL
jgi:pimeloyl-ACP methyl ester carboxylesterase